MLKKIAFGTTFALFCASYAQAQSAGATNVAIQNSPLLMEANRNSPSLAVIPAKTSVEMLDYAIDESPNKMLDKQSYLADNLYIKVSYNNLTGYVPAYYLGQNEGLKKLKSKAFNQPSSNGSNPNPADNSKTDPKPPKGKKGGK